MRNPNLTLATLYTDKTKTTVAPNPTATDIYGNLEFYVNPGEYVLDLAGHTENIIVGLHPEESVIAAATSQVIISGTASVNLSGHRIVTKKPNGTLEYASNDSLAYLNAPLWMTQGAALAGSIASVLSYGEIIESSWDWEPGLPIFLGVNGLLVQNPIPVSPGALFLAEIGTAITADSVFVDRKPSILLI